MESSKLRSQSGVVLVEYLIVFVALALIFTAVAQTLKPRSHEIYSDSTSTLNSRKTIQFVGGS